MSLKINPTSKIKTMDKGDQASFTIDVNEELDGNTVASYTYKIYDSADSEVTTNFGGGSSITSGIITFGLNAHDVGAYTIKFIITCNEYLPDSATIIEFPLTMTVTIV